MRSKLIDDHEQLQIAMAAIGFRGTWKLDYKAQRGRLSQEAGLVLPFSSKTLDAPISFLDLDKNLYPDDRAWFREARSRAPGASGRRIFEHRVIGQDGDVRWLQSHGHVIVDRYGNLVSGHGITLDVTAFKADGDSVQSSPHAPFAHPLNHLADGLMTANKAAREMGSVDIERSLTKLLGTAARILAYRIIKAAH